ncbi:MAG: hypothetical protein GXP08_16580 [Gammaproteobacteria bacterium]|nr:hypothetical protein [Gammaproteobacteria bacterium]
MKTKHDISGEAAKARRILAPELTAAAKRDTQVRVTKASVAKASITKARVNSSASARSTVQTTTPSDTKINNGKRSLSERERVALAGQRVSRANIVAANAAQTQVPIDRTVGSNPHQLSKSPGDALSRAKLVAASNAKRIRLRKAAEAASKVKVTPAKALQLKAARQAAITNNTVVNNKAINVNTTPGMNATRSKDGVQSPQLEAKHKRSKQQQPIETKKNQRVVVPDGKSKPQPASEEKKSPPIIKATALLAAKYPSMLEDTNDNRTKSETRIVLIVASIIALIIAFGWANWSTINFQSEGDFIYNSGLVGGIMMAVILIYALRKRVKVLRKAGNMEAWYYFHLIGGVLGPLIIVFHSSFDIKSVNSAVALFTMITIVFSGLFGRYIYTRIGYNLHRKLLAIKEFERDLLEKLRGYHSPLSDKIERRLSNFALASLTGPRSLFKLPVRLLAIRTSAMGCYVKVGLDLASMIKSEARRKGWTKDETKNRLTVEKDQLKKYINAIAEIANTHLLERVLVMWRMLHIPLLYILVITSLAHVLAVHMY